MLTGDRDQVEGGLTFIHQRDAGMPCSLGLNITHQRKTVLCVLVIKGELIQLRLELLLLGVCRVRFTWLRLSFNVIIGYNNQNNSIRVFIKGGDLHVRSMAPASTSL